MSPSDYEMVEQGYDPPRMTHPLGEENRARLTHQIADYLTKQFISERVDEMPKDECLPEARHILTLIDAALAAEPASAEAK